MLRLPKSSCGAFGDSSAHMTQSTRRSAGKRWPWALLLVARMTATMPSTAGGCLMTEQPYATQSLPAGAPGCPPSAAVADAVAPRWLLISREAAVASEQGGGDRWSVDHVSSTSVGRRRWSRPSAPSIRGSIARCPAPWPWLRDAVVAAARSTRRGKRPAGRRTGLACVFAQVCAARHSRKSHVRT